MRQYPTACRKGSIYQIETNAASAGIVLNHNNCADRVDRDKSIEFLPYQLWMVGYWPTMALTGNGELGFDSGEGA